MKDSDLNNMFLEKIRKETEKVAIKINFLIDTVKT